MNAPINSTANARHTSAGSGVGEVLALVLSWAAVGLPLAWGVAETLRKALALFN
jgi:hypothetical protein